MYYDYKRSRGILDRSAPPVKVPLLRSYNYADSLDKVVEYLYGNKEEGKTYYLADSSGAMIGSSELEVPGPNGTSKVPWTIGTYLRISVRYPSRARFYCVEKYGMLHMIFINFILKIPLTL